MKRDDESLLTSAVEEGAAIDSTLTRLVHHFDLLDGFQ